MTKEYVMNQLVYYLNYGFISKDLQEDIQEVLLKKKDLTVLERLLDSVEYEVYKKSTNKTNVNIIKNSNNNISKTIHVKNNNSIFELHKTNTVNINNNLNQSNDSINQKADNLDIVFIEEESKIKKHKIKNKKKIRIKKNPFTIKLFRKKKVKI